MLIDVTINRGTLNLYSEATTKSGKSGLLLASGNPHKVLFSGDPFPNINYEVVPEVLDANGIPVGYTKGAQEVDGFWISITFNAYVTYLANQMI